MKGHVARQLVIDDLANDGRMTVEQSFAQEEARKVSEFGDLVGEPVHPFVEHEIRKRILGALRRGRRAQRLGRIL